MSYPERFNAISIPEPDIKTKAELDMLETQRKIPEPRLELTPSGTVTAQVNSMVEERTQERLAQLRQSLDQAHSSIDKGFGAERLAGKAQADFGQAH